MQEVRGTTAAARLAALRATMQAQGLAAVVIPSADPHLSEYLPERWQGRAWLSGFTGSVGTFAATHDEAGVWVDSRYWVQAEAQLAGSGIALMRLEPGGENLVDWLATRLREGDVLAVDGETCSLVAADQMQRSLAARGVALRTDIDPLAAIWPDRAGLPARPIGPADLTADTSVRGARLAEVAARTRATGAQWHFLSSLDDIAWIFDLRGQDVDYNPVFLAHALLDDAGRGTLFVAPGTVSDTLRQALADDGIALADYEQVRARLAALPDGSRLLFDARRVVVAMIEAAVGNLAAPRLGIVDAINPSTLLKSRKTSDELARVRRTMVADGAALCEFFAWFDAALAAGEPLTELTVDERLGACRAAKPGYVCASFATIAGFNANGAMPHYRATTEAHASIAGDGLLLIDSGGQYRDGTTDITRMVPIGTPSAAQKRDCALVLKGMIGLSRAVFPDGLRAAMLDALARAPLWAEGLNYGHGTGHGVGFFLNVHEGPQSISCYSPAEPHTAMREGMITSVEPGLYREGGWGVRIENLVAAVRGPATEFGEFLAFETLTLCPIDTRCIDLTLLDDGERRWLNDYHATVRSRLGDAVHGAAHDWLIARTEPV
ncbi:aminopeptidase P family protein [Chitinasiproducens palmae]|nr:aminopeptidase P family protein [Chitinasiproducens palmae]